MPNADQRFRDATVYRRLVEPPSYPASRPRFPELREALLRTNPWVGPWVESFVERTRFAGPGACGYAREGRLVVAPSACTAPGRGHSWPGSVSDRTLRGVYLHECGHVFHYALGHRMDEVLRGLRAIKEPKVTSYEPNPYETFAETFRLFAGNPGLLFAGRPKRFEYLIRVGVAPALPVRAWEDGLLPGAPQRFFDQCERWIARTQSRTLELF